MLATEYFEQKYGKIMTLNFCSGYTCSHDKLHCRGLKSFTDFLCYNVEHVYIFSI